MSNCKALPCFNCDSIILADTPYVAAHPSGNRHLRMLRCPACYAITLRISMSESKTYLITPIVRERGYAKKGEWQEVAGKKQIQFPNC